MILVSLESWRRDLSKLMIRFWRTMPNFQILSKSKFFEVHQNWQNFHQISNFAKFKIWQKIKIPPRWFIVTLWSNQNSKIECFSKIGRSMGVTTVTKVFPKFWSRYQNPKISKIGSNHQNFVRKILKTQPFAKKRRTKSRSWWCRKSGNCRNWRLFACRAGKNLGGVPDRHLKPTQFVTKIFFFDF